MLLWGWRYSKCILLPFSPSCQFPQTTFRTWQNWGHVYFFIHLYPWGVPTSENRQVVYRRPTHLAGPHRSPDLLGFSSLFKISHPVIDPRLGSEGWWWTPCVPPCLGSLAFCPWILGESIPYHKWMKRISGWNFRHHVMAAAKIIFGQGPFLASLRMYHVGSCPAHSSFPSASSGEWDKKKSWLL